MSTDQNWIATPITADFLRGHLEVEQTAHGLLPHRLPTWARRQIPDDRLAVAEAQPSGVRLAFRTRATTIELDALPTKRVYRGFPSPPDGVYDLLVDGRLTAQATVVGGNLRTITDMLTQTAEFTEGPAGTARFTDLPEGEKGIEIWLPHTEITEVIALRTDAPVEPAPDRGRLVWLHHGSSISHGSNAVSPSTIWPALAAAAGDVELINLGFGGSALVDPFTARTMRDTPADLISVKLGINVVNSDAMRLRAFAPAIHGFLDTIREGHPATPLLVVSPVLCPVQEDTPGPLMPDLASGSLRFKATGDPAETAAGRLTLTIVRDVLADIVKQRAAEDPNLHYLDGRDLYGESDHAEFPLPDAIHPSPEGHRRIGENFAKLAFADNGPFATKTG
ncbi:GDSL-type esterase/lipase family protein [Streptomyces poonensis]|uniref:Lipase n=1 Tax=Streptomyces poonensis TaxID=68255 RepID=A0A918PFN2_9ACTN|nr:GDSL-type esterase/lipase family protein [Streptomyces poonensis]GGZ04343.1 lipase [Streptomyces poonensis]GLJ89355.1 lipase [Streptomyces poonensis]